MKNKLIALILLSASLAFAFTSGDGTYENPYEIAGQSDIVNLIDMVATNDCSGLYFLQTADIDLSPFGNFQGIGSPSAPFKGSYDGDGYILSNLTITASVSGATTNAFGFFGYCENPTLENMSVYGRINVWADYNASACVGVGGVIGMSVGGLFASLHNYVDIDVKISNALASQTSASNIKYGVGGVVGLNAWTTSGTTHIGCENYGNIYVDGANGDCSVGGCLVANALNSGTRTTFSGWNNYGKIIVNGTTETDYQYCSVVGGVCSLRQTSGGSSTSPISVGCSNFGEIVCSNSVNACGVASKSVSNIYPKVVVQYGTNYAQIVKVDNNSVSGWCFVGGVSTELSNYNDADVDYCVNFGTIKVSGSGRRTFQIGGVIGSHNGNTSANQCVFNKNFGDIEADCPNAVSVVVGGVSATVRKTWISKSENHGNIKVNTNGSVLIGGAVAYAFQGGRETFVRDSANYGSITANGNSNTNYSPCVGGVVASTRSVGSGTRNIVVSNCYNIGVAKLNLNDDGCYGAIYGVANTYGNYSVSIKNCYAIVGEGQNLIGAVDASNGNVSLENCVGIKSGLNGGIAYSVIGSNNWSQANTTLASYDDCYTDTYKCLGSISSGLFFPAEKSTNYFDLILPINTQLYPTPSAEDKKNHNYTKAQGYKRYIRTIQQ